MFETSSEFDFYTDDTFSLDDDSTTMTLKKIKSTPST